MRILYYAPIFWHNIFKTQIENPPDGVKYTLVSPNRDSRWKERIRYFLPASARFFVQKVLDYTKREKGNLVTSRPPVNSSFSLIHSNSLLDTNYPYILELEAVGSFVGGAFPTKLRKHRKTIISLLRRDNLVKIIPWTNATLEALRHLCGDDPRIISKCKIVYPAIKLTSNFENIIKARNESIIGKDFRILFIGNRFYLKGGLTLLKACEELSNNYPIKLTIISKLPKEIYEKYKEAPFVTLIDFKNNLPYDSLRSFYINSELFVMPTARDTFGFVFLEAMSCALPCIGSKCYAVPEIIKEGETGYCISLEETAYTNCFWPKYDGAYDNPNHPLVLKRKKYSRKEINALNDKIAHLIEDRSKRELLSFNAFTDIKSGKFNIQNRNKELLEIYNSVL